MRKNVVIVLVSIILVTLMCLIAGIWKNENSIENGEISPFLINTGNNTKIKPEDLMKIEEDEDVIKITVEGLTEQTWKFDGEKIIEVYQTYYLDSEALADSYLEDVKDGENVLEAKTEGKNVVLKLDPNYFIKEGYTKEKIRKVANEGK